MNNAVQIGKIFQNAREQKNLSLQKASSILKVKTRDINALEEGKIDLIKNKIYLYGFVNSYSKMLEIKDVAIDQFLKEISVKSAQKNQNHQLINLGKDKDINPVREDLINAMLIFTILYLILISLSDFRSHSTKITDILLNQFNNIK